MKKVMLSTFVAIAVLGDTVASAQGQKKVDAKPVHSANTTLSSTTSAVAIQAATETKETKANAPAAKKETKATAAPATKKEAKK